MEGFEANQPEPWWGEIDWDLEGALAKAQRSGTFNEEFLPSRQGLPSLPGFLWEVLRRTPECKGLVEALSGLFDQVHPGGDVPVDVLSARLAAQTSLHSAVGSSVFGALLVLRRSWRNSFDHLEPEPKAQWEAHYSPLWHLAGRPGTVPSSPVEFPLGQAQHFAEQWRTVFDLHRKPQTAADDDGGYEAQPIPGVFLRNFAKLKPSGRSLVEIANPLNDTLPGKTNSLGFPWVSLGILGKRLPKRQLHPVVLAVDFSKTTESIWRDFKHVIDEKRKELGICVTDRRVKLESFKQIVRLDEEVFKVDGKAPQSRVVKQFEGAAQLDLTRVLHLLQTCVTLAGQVDPEANERFEEAKNAILEHPISC